MIWNPFKANRLLQDAVEAIQKANETARGALDNAKKFEELCNKQADQIAERDFKITCLMANADPLTANRSTDHFELKLPQYVN